jgi:hypothetical protein
MSDDEPVARFPASRAKYTLTTIRLRLIFLAAVLLLAGALWAVS